MTKDKRTCAPEERLSIVQEGQREGRSQSIQKYNLSPSLYNKWRTKHLKDGIEGEAANFAYRTMKEDEKAYDCFEKSVQFIGGLIQ
jgi:transposase-like protein